MIEDQEGGGDPRQQQDDPSQEPPDGEETPSGKGEPSPDEPPGGKEGGGGTGHDPCEGWDCSDDPSEPPESRCDCEATITCECASGIPGGTIRRVLETLRRELRAPPACPGSPSDARDEFAAALDECEKAYEGIAAVEQSYREYFCQLDCELDKAEEQCRDLVTWSEQVEPGERECIERLWLCCYERPERSLQCECLVRKRDAFEGLKDCLEQARAREARASEDFQAVKAFQATLEGRFAELKKLWERAKSRFDAKQFLAVYALLVEYRRLYHDLGQLVLWEPLSGVTPGPTTHEAHHCETEPSIPDDRCTPPDLEAHDATWLRAALTAALKGLIEARFHRYCWHQDWIDKKHCADTCAAELEEFRGSRRDKFVLEALDCAAELGGEPQAAI